MQLSRRGDYSVRAMLEIASLPPNTPAATRDVGERQDIPHVFLTKIISRLAQAGLLRAYRGASGGVMLARPASEISLQEIIEAVEGPIKLNRCLVSKDECGRTELCPVHEVWQEAQGRMNDLLGSVKLADLVKRNAVPAGIHSEVSGAVLLSD
ncbi:MAG: Rrf2 family transcriptional regulator [Chloroflexi bacterium]|nr:Rrf2 family transcriptional regulator [Chloroflexota bacterium]